MEKHKIRKIFSLLAAILIGISGSIDHNMNDVFAEAGTDYSLQIDWDDDDNQYSIRPSDITYTVKSTADGTIEKTGTVTAENNWTEAITIPSAWGRVSITTDIPEGYRQSISISGTAYTKKFTAMYKDADSRVIVNTVWDDNNNAAGARPDSYSLTLASRMTGETYSYTVGEAETEKQITDIPFMVTGGVNTLDASIGSVSGYRASITTRNSSSGRSVSVTMAYDKTAVSDPITDGYKWLNYNGAKYHIYKASGNEKLALVSLTDNGIGTTAIENFRLNGKKIKAIVNASYFEMSQSSSYYEGTYGRAQGFSMGVNGYIDNRQPGPQDSGFTPYNSAGDKGYMDLVIDLDGNVITGDMNSWDYPYRNADGSTAITAGAAPAVVEVLNGINKEQYSPAVGAAKMTEKNTCTMLAKTADGSWALVVTEGNTAPRTDLRSFANAYGMTELSVYDGGGSTQMLVGGQAVYKASSRAIPNALIIYEDENEQPETADVTIRFYDSDANAELETYKIIKTVIDHNAANTDIAEAVNNLKNVGYEPVDDAWESLKTVDGSETDYTVNVKHIHEESTAVETKTFRRTITFTDGTNPLHDPVTQELTCTASYNVDTDKVTKEETNSDPSYEWESGNTFPALEIPVIENYETEDKVNALAVTDFSADTEYTQEVVYAKQASSVAFNFYDADADKAALPQFSTTVTVPNGETTALDLSDTLSALNDAGYELQNPNDIPASLTGAESPFSIQVVHMHTDVRNAEYNQTYIRRISFVTEDGTPLQEPVKQTLKAILTYSQYTDAVTKKVHEAFVSAAWENETDVFSAYTVPSFRGYTTNDTVPAMRQEAERSDADIVHETAVTYSKVTDIQTVEYSFTDEEGGLDMSRYAKAYDVDFALADEHLPDGVTDQINEVKKAGYVLVSSRIPSATKENPSVSIAVKHSHDTGEETVNGTVSRNIIYTVEGRGDLSHTDQQTGASVSVYDTDTDKVTGTKTSTLKSYTASFEAIPVAEIDGFTANMEEVPSATANSSDDADFTADVYVTYTVIPTTAVTVRFADTDEDNPQDLSAYDRTYNVPQDRTVTPDMSSAYAALKNAHYAVNENEIVLDGSKTEIIIPVSHTFSEEQYSHPITKTRTISFAFSDDSSKNYSVEQSTTISESGTKKVDLVTGAETVITSAVTGTMPTYSVPNEDGYTADKDTVPTVDFSDAEQSKAFAENVSVAYTKIRTIAVTVKFTDTDTDDPQNLSEYDRTYDVPEGGTVNPDLTDTYAALKEKHYAFEENNIVLNGSSTEVVIPVAHEWTSAGYKETIQKFRTIRFIFNDDSSKDYSTTQTADISETGIMETDLVTGREIKRDSALSGTMQEYAVPEVEGYTADKNRIPAVDFSNGEIAEDAMVTYSRIPAATVTVSFNDTDADKQDLSAYSKAFSVPEGKTVTADISSEVEALKQKNYVFTDESNPILDGSETDVIIPVAHNHAAADLNDSVEATRTISYSFSDDPSRNHSDVQKATVTKTGITNTDLVTGRQTVTVTGLIGKFDTVLVPEITGYTPDRHTVDAVDFSTRNSIDDYEKTISITYTKNSVTPSDPEDPEPTDNPDPAEGSSMAFSNALVLNKDANVPNVSFTYTIENGKAIPAAEGRERVYAGSEEGFTNGVMPTVNDVSFAPTDTATAESEAAEEEKKGIAFKTTDIADDEKFVKKNIQVSFHGVEFNEPGVYRYIIHESNKASVSWAEYDKQPDRTLDVYVLYSEESKNYEIGGYVLHTGTEAPAYYDTETVLPDKSAGYTNYYVSHDLAIRKQVSGNQASKDEYFHFRLKVSGGSAGDQYTVDLGKADRHTGINGASTESHDNPTMITIKDADTSAEADIWLQNNQAITVSGLPDGAAYSVEEDAEAENEGYAVSASVNGKGSNGRTASGTVDADSDVIFINKRSGIVPTGIFTAVIPFAAIGSAAAAFLAARAYKYMQK